MDAVILTQTFTGWVPQCYRITSCRFIQFKKRFGSFSNIVDNESSEKESQIQQHHDINHMECTASITSENETILQVDINHIQIFLKFQSNKEFVAWYRVLSASQHSLSNKKCTQRGIPSNISFAIYHLLQNLYFGSARTMEIKHLRSTAVSSDVKKLHYDLTVNNESKCCSSTDMNTLYETLIYTLTHMPTSLFTFEYEQQLSQQRMDDDTLKNTLSELYCLNKQSYKTQNGFDLYNRYGFLSILFSFLHHIWKQDSSVLAAMSDAFACALQSKQSDHSNQSSDDSNNFCGLVRALIEHAPHIFGRIDFGMASLISYTGAEMHSIYRYNAQVKEAMNMRKLIESAHTLQQHFDICDRKYRFKKYKQCFVGKDAIAVMMQLKFAENVEDAIAFGQLLVAKGIVQHVENAHEFKNGKFYYVFTNYSVASVAIPAKIQSVYAQQNSVMMRFDGTLVCSIREEEIGEYELPLGALFVDEHPGYATGLRLNNDCLLHIQLKCQHCSKDNKYVIDLELGKANNLDVRYGFVVLNVADQMKKSKVAKECVWNESMSFELESEPDTLFFTVFSTNMMKEEERKEEEEEEVIRVEIVSGYNLNKTSLLPIQYNPYVNVKCKHKQFKTKTIQSNANPQWNQQIVFGFAADTILFEVFNQRKPPQTPTCIGQHEYQMKSNLHAKGQIFDLLITCSSSIHTQNQG